MPLGQSCGRSAVCGPATSRIAVIYHVAALRSRIAARKAIHPPRAVIGAEARVYRLIAKSEPGSEAHPHIRQFMFLRVCQIGFGVVVTFELARRLDVRGTTITPATSRGNRIIPIGKDVTPSGPQSAKVLFTPLVLFLVFQILGGVLVALELLLVASASFQLLVVAARHRRHPIRFAEHAIVCARLGFCDWTTLRIV